MFTFHGACRRRTGVGQLAHQGLGALGAVGHLAAGFFGTARRIPSDWKQRAWLPLKPAVGAVERLQPGSRGHRARRRNQPRDPHHQLAGIAIASSWFSGHLPFEPLPGARRSQRIDVLLPDARSTARLLFRGTWSCVLQHQRACRPASRASRRRPCRHSRTCPGARAPWRGLYSLAEVALEIRARSPPRIGSDTACAAATARPLLHDG